MNEIICPTCRGDGELEYGCQNCAGTGYDPTDENPFGQCHNCYGECSAVQTCYTCHGSGVYEVEAQTEENNTIIDDDDDDEEDV